MIIFKRVYQGGLDPFQEDVQGRLLGAEYTYNMQASKLDHRKICLVWQKERVQNS